MRLDGRAVILALWITLLITTLTSTIIIDYFEDVEGTTAEGLPTKLEDTASLIAGFWVAGLVVGVSVSLLKWPQRERMAFASGLLGFSIATLIRLLALGQDFLPGSQIRFWNFVLNILSLRSIPDYHTFLLMVWIGGIVAVGIGVLISAILKQTVEINLPNLVVDTGNLTIAAALMSVSILFLLVVRNFETESRTTLTILDTKWLILPLTNMVVAAMVGFFIGMGYFAENRFAAAVTVFLGASVHVTLMLVLESYISTLDAANESTNLNNIPYLNFLFFWIGTPLVGGIAALALHNLRDAFMIEYEEEEQAA